LSCLGSTAQIRTSYLPTEILWGQRLTPLMTYQKLNGQYEIDFKQFHNAIAVPMPEYSAKEHFERTARQASPPVHYDDSFSDYTIGEHTPWSIRESLFKRRTRHRSGTPSGVDSNNTVMSQDANGKKQKVGGERIKPRSVAAQKSLARSRSESDAPSVLLRHNGSHSAGDMERVRQKEANGASPHPPSPPHVIVKGNLISVSHS